MPNSQVETQIGWLHIPPYVISRDDISVSQKLLLGRILGLITKEGFCYASNGWLASSLEGLMKSRSISNMISDLSDKGYVKVVLERNEKKEITKRKIYPLKVLLDPYTLQDVYPLPIGQCIPIHSTMEENKKEEDINNNNIYTVFAYWNSLPELIHHRDLSDSMKGKINARLQTYSLEEVKQCISNYAEILQDKNKYFFSYKWTLLDFFQRGFDKFADLEVAKQNYGHRTDPQKKNNYQSPDKAEPGKYAGYD